MAKKLKIKDYKKADGRGNTSSKKTWEGKKNKRCSPGSKRTKADIKTRGVKGTKETMPMEKKQRVARRIGELAQAIGVPIKRKKMGESLLATTLSLFLFNYLWFFALIITCFKY